MTKDRATTEPEVLETEVDELTDEVGPPTKPEAEGEEYTSKQIKVLKGLEGVRTRPAMYIGSTGPSGLHHLVYEIVDNAIDEAMAGYCSQIKVTLLRDGGVRVEDNGRGIPVDPMESEGGKSALEVIMTTLHAGGKFGGGAYKVSGGLHGVGASVVNALSRRFEVEVHRDGKVWRLVCQQGKVVEPVHEVGKTRRHGTMVTFWPDPEIFETTEFKFSELEDHLREQAFLVAGLKIILEDERDGEKAVFHYRGGVKEFVKHLNRNHSPLTKPIHLKKEFELPAGENGERVRNYRVEIAIQYVDDYRELILGFANNIHTKDGGTHLEGFKAGLTRVINKYAQDHELLKSGSPSLTGDDIREGCTAIVAVWLEEPQFEGQTKGALGNSEVKGLVQNTLTEQLTEWLEHHPGEARKIVTKAEAAARARLAARKAREIERKKSSLDRTLPGKLADCSSRDRDRCELFIVEGVSAAGTAKAGRDRNFQAILPIRGKIINVEKAGLSRVLNNTEIQALITAIGTNIDANQDLDARRYDKIIILTDADVDGAHIRTLLLTFFFRHMDKLVEAGKVYIAKNPLFRIRKGRDQRYYVFTEKERDEKVKELGGKVEVTRFKGLGEMDAEDLWLTTMNPETRTLIRVKVEDKLECEETFEKLMGSEVEPRRKFIQDYAREVENIDI